MLLLAGADRLWGPGARSGEPAARWRAGRRAGLRRAARAHPDRGAGQCLAARPPAFRFLRRVRRQPAAWGAWRGDGRGAGASRARAGSPLRAAAPLTPCAPGRAPSTLAFRRAAASFLRKVLLPRRLSLRRLGGGSAGGPRCGAPGDWGVGGGGWGFAEDGTDATGRKTLLWGDENSHWREMSVNQLLTAN